MSLMWCKISFQAEFNLNSVFSFYLPIASGRIIGFIPFPRVLVLCEMLTASFRNWTWVTVSISYVISTSQTLPLHHKRLYIYWITLLSLIYIYIYIYICVCVCVCVCVCFRSLSSFRRMICPTQITWYLISFYTIDI